LCVLLLTREYSRCVNKSKMLQQLLQHLIPSAHLGFHT
jgi:hypothetical protein